MTAEAPLLEGFSFPAAEEPPPAPGERALPVSPALVATANALSRLALVVVTALVALLSLLSGADEITLLLRTAATLLGLGLLLWLVNWCLASRALDVVLDELKKQDKNLAPTSTIERQA